MLRHRSHIGLSWLFFVPFGKIHVFDMLSVEFIAVDWINGWRLVRQVGPHHSFDTIIMSSERTNDTGPPYEPPRRLWQLQAAGFVCVSDDSDRTLRGFLTPVGVHI